LPTVITPASMTITPHGATAMSRSPFAAGAQSYTWPAEMWTAQLLLPPMSRAQAEDWIGWLVSLNGMEGSLLAGDPLGASPRGTWAGSPLVNGAIAAGARSFAADGFTAGATGKRGDWLQFGSASSARLHKVAKDFTANGSGQATIDIWPRTRYVIADNASFITASAVGLWQLASNAVPWSLGPLLFSGLQIPLVEDLRGL